MKTLLIRFAVFGVVLLGLSGCLDRWTHRPDYQVVMRGAVAQDGKLAEDAAAFVKERFQGVELAKNPDDHIRQREYQERLVQTELAEFMRSKGYYDARVHLRDAAADEWKGTYVVRPGEVYKLASVKVSPASYKKSLPANAPAPGEPLLAVKALQAQGDLYKTVQKDSCYFTLDVAHEAVIDRREKTAELAYTIKAGEKARFGPVTFEGQETIHEKYLRRRLPWKEGDCFERGKIETLKSALFESGLIASVDVVLPEKPVPAGKGKPGTVPVTVKIKERAHRTVSAGLTYYTDEGPGLSAGWKHRNFMGEGETLDATLSVNQLRQRLGAVFTEPYFHRKDQSLVLNAGLSREESDAFEEAEITAGAAIKRLLRKNLTGSTGISLSLTRIDDETTGESNNYGLISFPQTLTWDNRDSVLDPTKGWQVEGRVTPFVDAFGEASPFWKTELAARTYIAAGDRTVFAFRGKVGSILSDGNNDIPATERFYAGGGGSVRGFGYQDVGPQSGGDPTGGRGLVEVSAEARHKFTDTFGMVAFVDGGSLVTEMAPTFKDPAVGAGLGARYYTGFGPLRFDVAVPLTNKDDTDRFQIYLSIGQAF